MLQKQLMLCLIIMEEDRNKSGSRRPLKSLSDMLREKTGRFGKTCLVKGLIILVDQ